MTTPIQFINRPKFALSAQARASGASSNGKFSFAADDAVKIKINPSSSNKAANTNTSGTSVLGQFVTQLKGIVQQIQDTSKELTHVAQGTAQYDALTKQQTALTAEYNQAVQLQDANGQSTALGNVVAFLNTLTQAKQQGASDSALQSLYSAGGSLIGAQGLAALQEGGLATAQQLANGLQTLTVDDAGTIDQAGSAAQANDVLDSLEQVIGQSAAPQGGSGPSELQVSRTGSGSPIQINELNLGSAQNLSLSLRSASPDDLIRAAVTGVNQQSVDALILKPEDLKDDKKQSSYQLDPLQTPDSNSSAGN